MLTSHEDDFTQLVNHLGEGFSSKKVQFKKSCPAVKTSSPPTENINKNLACACMYSLCLYHKSVHSILKMFTSEEGDTCNFIKVGNCPRALSP